MFSFLNFANDSVDTRAFHTYASAYRINTVIVWLDSHLGTLSRDAGDRLDRNQAVINLRNLQLKQPLQEDLIRTGKKDLRVVIIVIHTLNDRTYGLSLR